MKFYLCLATCLLLLLAACGQNSTATPSAVSTQLPAGTAIVLATKNSAATKVPAKPVTQKTPGVPTVGATVTPPPLPGELETPAEPSPDNPTPTAGLALSPSVTPIPILPTTRPRNTATILPSPTALQVTEDALRGKILFKSTRSGGKYPSTFQFFVMDADGGNIMQLNKTSASNLYQQLKPLEGYSPDKSYLVLGEKQCGGNSHCDLYVGPPESIKDRSQGQWTPGGPAWYRADNPVWSPATDWIAFVWNRDNERTKNIFKGMPFETNQDFKRLTDFGGHRDTKNPTYSPDASQLVFATQDGSRWQIWTLDPNADNPTDANAHNLSDSSYDDWDPLWIK